MYFINFLTNLPSKKGFSLLFLWPLAYLITAQNVTIYTAQKIYLADTAFQNVEAIAVSNNRIIYTGTKDSALNTYPNATRVDYKKSYIYPGFIDAHCHFLGYAKGRLECNLIGTKSQQDVIKRVKTFAKKNTRPWLVGRGWDQNDWANKEYPNIAELDKAFPNTPVFLTRIDGHAAWINSAAVRAIHLDLNQKVTGGELVFKDGKFSGILVDMAVDLVESFIPEIPKSLLIPEIIKADKKCTSYGLTTVDDAGLTLKQTNFLDSLKLAKQLNLRFYIMLSANNETFAWIGQNGLTYNPDFHIGAVKFYLDGALGSRGALMKKAYCDRAGHYGLQLTKTDDFTSNCLYLSSRGYQVCVHAIGDSANKIALKTFNTIIPAGMDLRWRIEHAQVVDVNDMHFFSSRSIIPSIQPTHATSDAPWAPKRICYGLSGAYAYETLRKNAGIVALGTDFPVEDISPIRTFYSAVTRLDASGLITTPFIPEQALSRKNALFGMTLWAAYANKEEQDKGSLEPGKFADFVVLSQDIMEVPDKKIPKTKVLATYINGKPVYKK